MGEIMEIVVNNEIIKLEKNAILFGKNGEQKANFINELCNALQGKNDTLLINGRKKALKDYKIVILNEESDFEKEFKFTKSNALRQLIYNDEISKINEEKLLKYANELFNSIDIKINKLIDKTINKKTQDTLKMDIEITNINSIIDKFTNIYIDNKLINDTSISKAMKRKLLYQLYFLEIKNNQKENYIVLLNNFDVYLSVDETIELLEQIEKLSNVNCNFILTTTNDIFEYINQDMFKTYKIGNKIYSLSLINDSIENYLMEKVGNNIPITVQEITDIKNRIFNNYPHVISKILNSDDLYFLLSKPKKIKRNYVVCNQNDKKLFEKIHQKFID